MSVSSCLCIDVYAVLQVLHLDTMNKRHCSPILTSA